jgi:hypothetical protein
MAGPPATVVKSYKQVGQLRLHRLAERINFRCARCRGEKNANLVATMEGDWERTICNGCYGLLVSQERRSKKEVSASAGLKARTSKKTKKEKRKGGKSPQPITPKERQQLERRLPGLNRLISFFRAAEIPVELVRGGRLWINRQQTGPLTWSLPDRRRLDWNSVIDEMALEYAGDRFAHAVADNARFGAGLRAFLRRREKGFEIKRDEVRLAMIHATHARVPSGEWINANFLTPGPHWQQLADVVHRAESQLVAEWRQEQAERESQAAEEAAAAAAEALAAAERVRAAARRRLDEFPAWIAAELEEVGLEASRKIREERQVAYERPVVLENEHGELTLLPIKGPESRLLVPFVLIGETDTLRGELLLAGTDPLPLFIPPEVDDDQALIAWTSALLGFADATCIELAAPAARTMPVFPPRRPARSGRRTVRDRSSAIPRRRTWPSHLEPIGHWVRYSGSFVAGHRRRLDDDHQPSAEARARARQVGIVLAPNETWVRPHTRGVPDGLEMRFRWSAPEALGLAYDE